MSALKCFTFWALFPGKLPVISNQVWKSSVPLRTYLQCLTPPIHIWCLRSLRWKHGKGGATTLSIAVLKVSPCKHQLTTAKVLEQILLPRQAGRAELFPKDWMLPAFWISVKSNIKGPSVLHPQSIKNTALHPPCYSLYLLKKVPADIFLLL